MRKIVFVILLLVPGCAAEPQRGPSSSTRWKTLESAPSKRTEVAAAAVGGKIFVAGGFVPGGATVALVEVYDPARDEFSSAAPLPLPVNHPMSASDGESLFIIGGYAGQGLTQPTDRALVFDGSRWTELPRMPEERAAGGAAFAAGKIFVVGGVGPAGLATKTFIYDLAAKKWTTAPGLTTPREHLGVASDGKKVYAVGGRAPENLGAAEVFDPGRGKWSSLPSMPTPRGGMAAAFHGGRVFAVGGEGSDGTFDEVEAFDLRSRKWSALAPLPTPRHGLGVVTAGGVLYVIAGGPEPGYSFSNTNEALDLGRPS